MHISDDTLRQLILEHSLMDEADLGELQKEADRDGRPLLDIVLDNNHVDELSLTKLNAARTGFPFIELAPQDIPSEVLNRIPERIARQYNAIVFKIDDTNVVHLAMDDPEDVQAVSFIEKEVGNDAVLYMATASNILACLELYRGDVNEELNEVIDIQREDDTANQKVSEADLAEDSPIAQTINLLLEYAIRSNASDIHIEPREDYVQVRYRIDGVLKEVNRLPRNVLAALVSRVKILSNLKIDERRVPQDGRFKIKVAGKQYALRVSTLPITDGEKIVMRILDETNKTITLKQLGYWGHSLKVINEAIIEPNGMILVTGPTGSGKSTSLFSVLTRLNTPDVNISTIEDPVEYKIPGVNQTQTNAKAGMTFANGLRALLRQDPNIIMVGEIRDGETANLGIQAALTGHLVFSTLHTNNAATCLPRLLDMGIEPFLIASTVKAVVGQRLVRRLCIHCRESHPPTPEQMAEVVKLFGVKNSQSFGPIHELEKQALEQDIGSDIPLSTTDTTVTTLYQAHAEGCKECNMTGYKGRVGIYEVLGNTVAVQKLIMANATSTDIQDQSVSEGMVTMFIDGLIKALRGSTTIEEVLRVTRE
jgi:type IV pilus assembly protein PilB